AASLSEEEGLGELNEQYNTLEGEKAALQEELNEASIEDINNISSELTENTEQRLELLQEESTLIESSNEVFDSARDAAENISNEEYKKQADSLITSMDARYDAHGSMTNTYTEALNAEQALFEYLGEEDNEPISEATERFASETEKINQLKGEIEQILENN